jgi:hypothetical protein
MFNTGKPNRHIDFKEKVQLLFQNLILIQRDMTSPKHIKLNYGRRIYIPTSVFG